MRDQNREAARVWFEQAADDLRLAAHVAQGGFHADACFHCQQAAEKALKAVLYARRRRAITTHATQNLVDEAARHYPGLAQLAPACRHLDLYYATTRYPNAIGGASPCRSFDADQSAAAIADARAVIVAVAEALDFESPEAGENSTD